MGKYSDMTKAELEEVARSRNIEGRSSMSRDELEKALTKASKGGTTSNVVTPRASQSGAKAVAYLDEGEERDLSGTGGEVAPSGAGTADGGSLGGTITGPDVDTGTTARPNPNPAPNP